MLYVLSYDSLSGIVRCEMCEVKKVWSVARQVGGGRGGGCDIMEIISV